MLLIFGYKLLLYIHKQKMHMMIAYALSFPRLSTEKKHATYFDRATTQNLRHLMRRVLHKLEYTIREDI